MSDNGGENDMITMSLLILAMTFVMLRYGLSDAIGIAAFVAQVGILVRINYVHGNFPGQVAQKTEA